MTSREADNTADRAEMLMELRHITRRTLRVAEQLASAGLVGYEVRGLLGRLQAIRAELDAMPISVPELRRPQNDPLWSEPPFPFRRSGAN
jgi:hypothetical protein